MEKKNNYPDPASIKPNMVSNTDFTGIKPALIKGQEEDELLDTFRE